MDLLDDLGIDDGTLPFRIAVLQEASGRLLGVDFDWPMVAAESLAAGLETPALVSLAAAYRDADSITIRQLVLASAAEIGLRRPSPGEAIRCWGMIVNRALLNDLITPDRALRVIESLTDYGDLDGDLFLLYAPAYDWDEAPAARDDITAQVKMSVREALGAGERPLREILLEITGTTPA